MVRTLIWIPVWIGILGTAIAGESGIVPLPPPHTEGGMPLMQALKARRSSREFDSRPLPVQVLSDLLWAANGVNRPDSGKRTAPTAKDMREILVYVLTAEAAHRYEPDSHSLRRVAGGDLRRLAGTQDFVAQAPVNLVYVADLGRMDTTEENKRFYPAIDTGFVAQNVYLFCASAGLATVVRASVDRQALSAALGLGTHRQIVLAQTVGYPR